MKKVFYGWVGKSIVPINIVVTEDDIDGWIRMDQVYLSKGRKSTWYESDWPPRKVKITVEDA